MTKKKRILFLAAAVCLLIALGIGLASCSEKKEPESAATETFAVIDAAPGEKIEFTVQLKSEGGKPLENVGVYFYTDSTMAELVWFAKTDAEGKAGFTDVVSSTYVAVLDAVPEGYKVEPFYSLTGRLTEITLGTDMADGDLANITYKLGDVMMNFSVTAPDGTVYVLSELLEEKEAVVLNFWYLQCNPCRAEFPYLQEAYEKYSEKLEILALNPINDDNEAIAAFRQELGLTFPMAYCDPAWEKALELTAYPTTVIIDRFGTIGLIHTGSVDEAKIFEDAFEFFTRDDYEQTTVKNIKDAAPEEVGSNSENPIEIGGKTSFTVTVQPGQLVYYHLYRLDGMELTINNKNAYAVVEGKTIENGGGSLTFKVKCPDSRTPAKVAFGNTGSTPQTYSVTLEAEKGTFNNPYKLKLGEFSTRVQAGNEQGVYYTYTATKDGLLTVQCLNVTKGVEYDYSLLNESTMAMRTLTQDGDAETKVVSVPVKKGQKVRLTVNTAPDESNSYPAATFKSKAYMDEKAAVEEEETTLLTYAVSVTDADRKLISKATVINLTQVPEAAAEDAEKNSDAAVKTYTLKTENGVASQKLEAGVYDAVLKLPSGYTANSTEFQLTEEQPYVSIKLDKIVEVEKFEYVVTVKNEEGYPLSGVTVTVLGLGSNQTDTKGEAKLLLPEGNHTVYVSKPEGYLVEGSGYSFEEGSRKMLVLLQEGYEVENPDEDGKLKYTVTVQDYSGNPEKGVTVTILKNGKPAAAPQVTGSDGKISARLESGSYTVSLDFSGTQKYYSVQKAVLSPSKTSLTVKVASAVSTKTKEVPAGTAYYLQLGGNYAEMQKNTYNYYIFEPTEAGLYRFSTSDADARLSYWGGEYFSADMTESTDYDETTNSFTHNVKESSIGVSIVVGVKGASNTIVEVVRLGDPILDETDIPYEKYVGTHTPKKFTMKDNGKKLVYVDITANTAEYTLVKDSSGFYHLNSADGPLLYMNIGPDAKPHSLYYMAGNGGNGVAGNGVKATLYDENGEVEIKYDFSDCITEYGNCMNATYGVYPLTEDLRYIVETAGEYQGWWDSDSKNFWLSGWGDINPEIAWMFAVCYVPK